MALEIGNRKRCRARDHAVYREPPVGEAARLKALELFGWRSYWVGERRVRNLAGRELAGHGMLGEDALRRIGQRFACAIENAGIGWDKSVVLRKTACYGQARCARGCCDPGGDQFAA